ncbi:MAG TPA: hypothetical protein VM925_03310, partial [Labilithrix sp.]|nr:hypothetical protein [Labilithrix sp.]
MKRLVSFVALALAAACSARARSDDPSSQDDDVVASDDAFFGHDRVGAALTGHRERIPTTLAEVEALYGIGRACTRADSKEIFVVEETRSRTPAGEVTGEGAMIPRAVVSGCNTGDLADPESVARSTSLFAALVSDPSRAADTSGDGILREPVEVMARDDRTGIYNFYVFAKDERGNPEVTRILRDGATGAVLERRLPSRGRASPAMPPANDSKRCFACHVNGGPLMNEMRDPWTNWISFKKSLPLSRLDGETKA